MITSPAPGTRQQTGRSPGLWPVVWLLLKLRVTILISGFRRSKLRTKIAWMILGALFLGFLGFVFFISWMLLRFLRSPQLASIVGDVTPFLDSFPVLITSAAFLGILLTSFGVLLQALYLAGDMDFLLSAPIPIRAVFITKLLQAILPNFTLFASFGLPVLFGLGLSGGYQWLYYPSVLFVLAALALAAAGISSMLVMLIVRLFPARRVAEVLGFIGATASFLCSQSGQLARFERFTPEQATQALSMAENLKSGWSPLAWAGRGLVALGAGAWLPAVGYLVLSVGGSILIFLLALTVSERLYYSGWASIQSNRKNKKKSASVSKNTRQAPVWVSQAENRLPAAVRAIVVKDYFVLRRDLRNMSQLVTPLIFGIVYAITFFRDGGPPVPAAGTAPWLAFTLRNLPLYGSVGISLFVGWMLLARLAGMGFSQEGRNYWIVKTAPVRAGYLLFAKFLVAYIPALVLGVIFLLGISLIQRAGLDQLWFTLPAVTLIIAGNAGLNLAFGVTGARLDWEDPRQMQRGTIGCLGGLAGMVFLPVSLALFFSPALAASLFGLPELLGQLLGLGLGAVFCLACAVVPLWLVVGRVSRLGES